MDFDRHFNLFRRHVDSLFDDFDRSFYRNDPYLLTMPDELMSPNNTTTNNNTNTQSAFNKEGENSNTTMSTRDNNNNNVGIGRNNNSLGLFNNRSLAAPSMKVDVIEEPNAYVVNAELPGLSKEDVKLTVDNDILTISAERKNEFNEEDKNKRYVRMERSYGAVSRSLRLPQGCDASKITARHENGVLKVSVPRNAAQNTAKSISIQ
jgi:HSP20 family protein